MSRVEPPTLKRLVARPSLAKQVYEHLLESIVTGERTSGSKLNLSAVARELDVSPIPVREALVRLEADGLIHSSNNRSATVARFAERDVVAIFQVREILESGAARLAAKRIEADQLDRLRELTERCFELYGDPARKRTMLDLDNQFHLLIADAADNESLKAEIVRYNHRVRVLQTVRLDPVRMGDARSEHLEVIGALQSQDPEVARAAMSRHVRASFERIHAAWPADR